MLAKDFLSNKLYPLRPSDSARVALEIMNESNVAFLPVVENETHLGYVSAQDLMDIRPSSRKISQLINPAYTVKIREEQHLFEIIKIFSEINSTVVTVVHADDRFMGIISAKELINSIAAINGFGEPGGILTLEMGIRDYHLSEITRIIEHNNAKVLSLYINIIESSRKLQVHIKLNTTDLKSVIAAFERYNYSVVAIYYTEEDVSGLKSRYDLLMKYLDL
jgi:acetoin utilization protein AcuB